MTPASRALGVMGKAPVPGAVKTRLTPPLGERQAAQLYGAFLRDTLLTALAVTNVHVSLFHPPSEDISLLSALVPAGVTCVEETGADLGESMQHAIRHSLDAGASSVVIIGTDLPTLPVRIIEEAFTVLERGHDDLVFGPSADGGYYLIGLRSPQPALFEGMRWSTNTVLAETLERSQIGGLRATLLEIWRDVDEPDDLKWLWQELELVPASVAPTTRKVLSELWQPRSDFGKSAHGSSQGNTIC